MANSLLAVLSAPLGGSASASAQTPVNSGLRRGLGQLVDPAEARIAGGAGKAFAEALQQANADRSEWPSVALGAGEFDLGADTFGMWKRSAAISGISIDASRLFGTGRPILESRNYAGRIANLSLFAGRPGQGEALVRRTRCDGLLLDWTGGHGEVSNVQVNNCNGYGIRINNVWDAVLENIIVVDCGNADNYAFEVRSVGDTSNHTMFSRLQVEDSHERAILFDASNINLIVDGIHSEGTVGNGVDYTHQFLGGFCSFRNARISNDGGGVRVRLGGGRNSYRDMWFQHGVHAEYQWGSSEPEFRSLIDNCMFDVLRIPAANVGKVSIRDCFIRRLIVEAQQPGTVRLSSSDIGSLEIIGDRRSVDTGRYPVADEVTSS